MCSNHVDSFAEFVALRITKHRSCSSVCSVFRYADLDDKRMNAPLDPNKSPDDWGVRAALEAAFITPAEQQELWQVLAAILHLGNLKFKYVSKHRTCLQSCDSQP